MFDRTMRKGLMARMLKNLGLQGNPMAGTLVYPIASACYPKAIKRNEEGILEPKISVERIRDLTEGFVDYGSGSIGDLYQKIWGVDGFEGYLEEFVGPLFECSECGSGVPEDATSCPNCRETFDDLADDASTAYDRSAAGIGRIDVTSRTSTKPQVLQWDRRVPPPSLKRFIRALLRFTLWMLAALILIYGCIGILM